MPPAIIAVGVAIGAGAVGVTAISVLGVTIASGALASALVLGAAAGFIASAASKLLSMPDVSSQTATNQELQVGGVFEDRLIVGETVVSGTICKYKKKTHADKKEYHHLFVTLAGHQCESVTPYQLDGKNISRTIGNGYYMQARLGTQTTALARAVSQMGIESSFIGFNVTDVYCEFVIDPEIFPNGLQDLKFKVRGLRIYDPRKDSTVGGDGEHRIDDASTWEWSQNAALINFHWKLFRGAVALPIDMFSMENIAAQANICDEQCEYTDSDGQTQYQPRYTCNGALELSNGHEAVETSLLSSCGGHWIESAGQFLLQVAAYQGPAEFTITQQDCVEPPIRSPHTSLSDRCNKVTATYVNKDLYYQATDMTPIVSTFLKDNRDEGQTFENPLQLNFTDSNSMAQRLAVIHLNENAAGDTISLKLSRIGWRCQPGKVVYLNMPSWLINGSYQILSTTPDLASSTISVEVKETSADIFNQGTVPANYDLTPNLDIDNAYVEEPTSLQYTPTPNDSARQGLLTWDHSAPISVRRYIGLILKVPDDGFVKTFYANETEHSLNNMPNGAYTLALSAENRFEKRSIAAILAFNIGLPSTPSDSPLRYDVLPGRVIIVGPDLPNSSATYQWRYSFTDDFDSALIAADGTGVTIVGTRQDDTLYLWYRLKEGDLVDPNWIQVVIPNLIGLTSDEIRPDVIAGITLPSLPNTLLDTLSGFSQWLNDQDYYNEELEAGQISLFEDIQMVNDALAIVDEKTTTVGVEVGLVSAKVAQAFRAISSDRMSRAILESKLQAQFGDLSSVYLKTVDLYTSAGAARARDLTQLGVTVGNVNAKAENNLILIAEEEAARISDITERRIATEAVDAKATNSLQLIADEEQARIEDIEQRRLATEGVDARVDESLVLLATETQARIDAIEQLQLDIGSTDIDVLNAIQLIQDEESARIADIEQRRIATEAVDAKAVDALNLIATETQARITAIEQRRVATVAATAKADNALDLIADEEQARIQLGQQLTSTFNNSLASYVKQSELFSSAGAARASDLSTVSARVGSTSVASQITSFKNAQIGYENGSGNWVQGAAFAQAFSEVKITGSLGNNLSIYSYFEAIEDELGQVSGEIQFAVNNDGRITGVFVKGSSTQSVLTFVGNSIRIVATNGTTLMSVNASTNRMTIYADGEFTGTLRSANFEIVGANYMEVRRPTPFGPDNLYVWEGSPILSGGNPNYSALRKSNATVWRDNQGNSYFGGSLSAGLLKNATRSSLKGLNPSIEIGPFGTNGGSKQVVASITWSGRYSPPNHVANPPGSTTQPSCTIKLYRSFNGTSWGSPIATQNATGTTTVVDTQSGGEAGIPRWFTSEYLYGAITFTDNNSSSSDFYYKVEVTNQVRHHSTSQITSQETSVISTE